MDFENIEGLNGDQIIDLYNDVVESDTFLSVANNCYCRDRSIGEWCCKNGNGTYTCVLTGCK